MKLYVSLLDNYFIVEVQENGTILKLVFLVSVEDQTLVFLHVVWYWNLGREGRGVVGGLVYLNVAMECDL